MSRRQLLSLGVEAADKGWQAPGTPSGANLTEPTTAGDSARWTWRSRTGSMVKSSEGRRAQLLPYARSRPSSLGNLDPGERVEVGGSPRSALQ